MIRLPVFIVIWLAFITLKSVVVLIGLIVIPYLYRHRHTHHEHLRADKPWWGPWINPEDWKGGHMTYADTSLPRWWVSENGASLWSFFKYHAIRNPANGLRNYEALDLDIDPDFVEYRTNRYMRHYEPQALRNEDRRFGWYLCWQGWRAGTKVVFVWNHERHFVLKLGWRVQPSDTVIEIDPDGVRHEDAGFATKLLVYRKG